MKDKKDLEHNWFNNLRHRLFGHQVVVGNWVEFMSSGAVNTHARCKYCGYEGLIDSQGNLF